MRKAFIFLLFFSLLILPASAQVTVSIGDLEAYQNESITAPIMINNVTNYGTGTINLTYDPSVVHVTDVASTADSTVAAWNADNEAGYVRISAWNLMGISGDIAFANVTFKAVGSPDDVSDLNIEIITLADTSYNDINATPLNGSFSILTPPTTPTPTPTPTLTPTPSPRPVAVPTTTPIGIAVLIGMLSVIATIVMIRKRE